jgi:hypothetical protein
MSDRELLEMAAKAAGVEIVEWQQHAMTDGGFGAMLTASGIGHRTWWNPLTDDGDALRLAVKLKIEIGYFDGFGEVHAGNSEQEPVIEPYRLDMAETTRRSIVRAAAQIGTEGYSRSSATAPAKPDTATTGGVLLKTSS